MQPVTVCHLGHIAYEPAWAMQQRVQARLVQAKRATPPEALPHVLLLVEHPPVYTLGQRGDRTNLRRSADELAALGATFVPVDRGGDITFHGPGQLVAYPLFDLDRLTPDIHHYLRLLEEAVIGVCADYGLAAGRVPGRTGVWIGPDERGPERKVCAMGIRASRWVTMHGLALNINTDLRFFDHIVPCGIADRGVTSLAQELGQAVPEAPVAERLLHHLAAGFGLTYTHVAGAEAVAWLDAFAPPAAAPPAAGLLAVATPS